VIPHLQEQQRIPTSGARAVEAFRVDGLALLAIPQLALDVPGAPAGMNAGNSDTELLLLRDEHGRYEPFGSLPAPGGEDAEFFQIGDRSFLAVACIRTGSGPYEFTTDSFVHEWCDGGFRRFQTVPTFAAKQWRHWQIGDRHFLGLAQGLALPGMEADNCDSVVFEWTGTSFEEFQVVPSRWGYNWYPFEIDGTFFVAHADHVVASRLFRWDGERLVAHQDLLPNSGRAFAHIDRDDGYLLVAGISLPPRVLRWDGDRFVHHQELAGAGARELRVVEMGSRLLVIRVNFITGTPADPEPALHSQIYEWRDRALQLLMEFPTVGATDVEVLAADDAVTFAVSQGLSREMRFVSETVVYRLALDDEVAA
jgi:hypothetical protein